MNADGDYSEALDAYFNAADQCWTCAVCFAVLGSMACCRSEISDAAEPEDEPEPEAPAAKTSKPKKPKAKKPPSGNPVPRARTPGPFEIRIVDEERRRYVLFASGIRLYAHACEIADRYVTELRSHFVVWWPAERRVLYDSRAVDFRWPWWRGNDEAEETERCDPTATAALASVPPDADRSVA